MGEPMLPQEYQIGKESDRYNYKKLETMLNTENCFDIALTINNYDILELNFSYNRNTEANETIHLVYEFIYRNNKWKPNVYDPFNTNKLKKNNGKIVNPFARTK